MTARSHMLSTGIFVLLPMVLLEKRDIVLFEHLGVFNLLDFGIFFSSMIFGSLLPDVDEPESKIGRKTPFFISNVIKIIFGHRGLTHSFLIFVLILLVSFYFTGIVQIMLSGLAFGIFAHILGDMTTHGGVKDVYFPLGGNKRYTILPSFLLYETNSTIEKILVRPILLAALGTALYLLVEIRKGVWL